MKHSMNLTYPSYKGLYDRIEEDENQLVEKIDLILNTEYLLSTNANVMLLMDSLMYKL